jgi:hypothetical protein
MREGFFPPPRKINQRFNVDKLAQLQHRISQLEEKKKTLLKSQSEKLLKEATKILGNTFSPELVLTVLSETWTTADAKTKEAWLKKATTFRQPKSRSLKSKTA